MYDAVPKSIKEKGESSNQMANFALCSVQPRCRHFCLQRSADLSLNIAWLQAQLLVVGHLQRAKINESTTRQPPPPLPAICSLLLYFIKKQRTCLAHTDADVHNYTNS